MDCIISAIYYLVQPTQYKTNTYGTRTHRCFRLFEKWFFGTYYNIHHCCQRQMFIDLRYIKIKNIL